MAYQYPHTIENGGGEQLTFIQLIKRENEAPYLVLGRKRQFPRYARLENSHLQM